MTRTPTSDAPEFRDCQVISTREASVLLRIHKTRLINKIRSGEIEGYLEGGRYVLTLTAVRKYQEARQAARPADVAAVRVSALSHLKKV